MNKFLINISNLYVYAVSYYGYGYFLACDKSQDFFCKGNDNAACKGQKAVSSLGRVVGFEGKTNLHDTKTEHNHTDSPHQTENESDRLLTT